MSSTGEKTRGYAYSDEMTAGVRARSGLLVLLSSSAVALAFGISFYFALVSSGTAIATQFPELAPVVSKLKSILVVNTFGFVSIIILSFWVLSRLVTSKMFVSLGIVMSGLRKAAENRYPEQTFSGGGGPFGEFESLWSTVVSETREREKREIEVLERSLPSLSGPDASEARDSISRLIEEKKRRIVIGGTSREKAPGDRDGSGEPLFMQPV